MKVNLHGRVTAGVEDLLVRLGTYNRGNGERGATFLAGVDFGDGHGGVTERKVGCGWKARSYLRPLKSSRISHADYLTPFVLLHRRMRWTPSDRHLRNAPY